MLTRMFLCHWDRHGPRNPCTGHSGRPWKLPKLQWEPDRTFHPKQSYLGGTFHKGTFLYPQRTALLVPTHKPTIQMPPLLFFAAHWRTLGTPRMMHTDHGSQHIFWRRDANDNIKAKCMLGWCIIYKAIIHQHSIGSSASKHKVTRREVCEQHCADGPLWQFQDTGSLYSKNRFKTENLTANGNIKSPAYKMLS